MLRASGSSRRETSFPSQAEAACPGTNAISSRGASYFYSSSVKIDLCVQDL
jgi:hypothetical protein